MGTVVKQDEILEKEWLNLEACEFNWVALYNDETALTQFRDGVENSFGDIDQDKIMAFCITDGENILGVDLTNGEITFNERKMLFDEKNNEESNAPYRLIYFRRNQMIFSPGVDGQVNKVMHCVGWQRKTKLNGETRCVKNVIGIDKDLVITILDE